MDLPLQKESERIFRQKHQLPGETTKETFGRVAAALATSEMQTYDFCFALENGMLGGGRIMANAGAMANKPAASLINCTVAPDPHDSIDGIGRSVWESMNVLKAGCGIGYNFSSLRPKGAFVNGPGAYTTGALPFMDIFNVACATIASAGGRRGAQMAVMNVDHPDIEDYIKAKRKPGAFQQFNLSVGISDLFMKRLEEGAEWHPHFTYENGRVFYGKATTAKALWDLIMRSTYEHADPGVLFLDTINGDNLLRHMEKITATNPCVTADTKILTRKGQQDIGPLEGQQIEIWNGFEWSEVLIEKTGVNQKLIEVGFSNGLRLTCTRYHGFYLSNRDGKIEAKDLKIGDVTIPYRLPLIVSDTPIHSCAYTMGFFSGDVFSGDGYVRSGRSGSWLDLYGAKKHLLPFLTYSSIVGEYPIIGGYVGTDLTQTKIRVKLSDDTWDKMFVPDLSWSVENRLNWFAGLLDSDGNVAYNSNKKRSFNVQLTSKSYTFLKNVALMLATLGVKCTIEAMKDCHRLSIKSGEFFKLQELGIVTNRLNVSYNSPAYNMQTKGVSVTSIRALDYTADVYCFTEPKRGTAVFNNILTGNCGEQPLPPYGSCLLGAVNLTKFIRYENMGAPIPRPPWMPPIRSKFRFDWDTFTEVVRIGTEMLDNVVEHANLPVDGYRKELISKRRHGMGIMGFGSLCNLFGWKYGGDESIAFLIEVLTRMNQIGWGMACTLANKKGPAPIFNEMSHSERVTYGDNFIKKFGDGSWQNEVAEHAVKSGLRFTHHTSIAPTGTLASGIGNNCSNGIEPSFAHRYIRNLTVEGRKTREAVEVLSFEQLVSDKLSLNMEFQSAYDITPDEHLRVQAEAQKWVDSAISKTINVPHDIPYEEFQGIYLKAWKMGCKGVTTFRMSEQGQSGILQTLNDLNNISYTFTMKDGSTKTYKGGDVINMEGEETTASNLYNYIRGK